MDYLLLQEQLAKRLKGKRYKHSLGVSATAEQLAKRFGASPEKAKLAGLLHDCAREFPDVRMIDIAVELKISFSAIELSMPILLHAAIGAQLAVSQYGIDDAEICRAIRLHTTGAANMSLLDKILYLADMIEPGRDFPEVGALRRLAERDLDAALLATFDQSIHYVLRQKHVIHPDTVIARNEILLKGSFDFDGK